MEQALAAVPYGVQPNSCCYWVCCLRPTMPSTPHMDLRTALLQIAERGLAKRAKEARIASQQAAKAEADAKKNGPSPGPVCLDFTDEA